MNIFLAGTYSRENSVRENDDMKLYLAGEGCYVKDKGTWENWPKNDLQILESFYYIKPWQLPFIPVLLRLCPIRIKQPIGMST